MSSCLLHFNIGLVKWSSLLSSSLSLASTLMLLILAFLYTFQRFTQSGAVPLSINFSRQTNNASPLSQECVCPDVRSIWDIVWSCLVTLFACSWVSVHPNIPGKATPWWKKYLFRLELMFWSIVAPELIIEWAMRQWFGAHRLSRDYREYKWTKTHGYFIQMGGFMLYDSEDKKPIQVLSPDRIGSLLRAKRIDMPSINEEEIQDRSKSDGLAKALVIIQTLWFIGQCIARKAQGLDITELELVTLALAMLNGVIYFLWWNKPLGVESTVAVYLKPPPVEGDNDMSIDGHKIKAEAVADDNRSENTQALQHADPVTTHMRNMTPRHLAQKAWWFLSGISYRWPFALAVAIFTRISEILGTGEGTRIGTQMHVGPFYSYYCLSDRDSEKVQFVLMFTAASFGAVHCAGWNFVFPSLIEAYLWRISSAIITGFPALSVMVLGTMFLDHIIPIPQPLRWVIYSVMMAMFSLAIVVLPFYILARLALLVEALISLRDLRQGALGVVKWTLSLPHI